MSPKRPCQESDTLPLAWAGTGTGLVEDRAQAQAVYTTKMAEVSGDELQVVVNGRCRDLKISVGQHPAGRLQLSPESAVDPGDLHIVREHRQGGQHSCLDVPKVATSFRRTVRSLEELADHDRARELFGAWNTAEPSHVPWQWTASQHFGDRVGVEEEGHSAQRD
jgi:hypothetical protein